MLGAFFSSTIGKAISVFALSMVPVIELRGAIPMGFANDLPLWQTLLLACVGNMLPVPFIIIFIRKLFAWLKKNPLFSRLISWLEKHVMEKEHMLHKNTLMGLCILVAIPLPGTGAWTGAMLAGLLDMRLKEAVPVIALGVLIAAAIVCAVSYGVIGAVGVLGL